MASRVRAGTRAPWRPCRPPRGSWAREGRPRCCGLRRQGAVDAGPAQAGLRLTGRRDSMRCGLPPSLTRSSARRSVRLRPRRSRPGRSPRSALLQGRRPPAAGGAASSERPAGRSGGARGGRRVLRFHLPHRSVVSQVPPAPSPAALQRRGFSLAAAPQSARRGGSRLRRDVPKRVPPPGGSWSATRPHGSRYRQAMASKVRPSRAAQLSGQDA
jgi:hypothetical protein